MKWICFVSVFFMFACESVPVEVTSKTFTFKKDTPHYPIVKDPIDTNSYFQRLDTINRYGFGFHYKFSDEDLKPQIRMALIIKGKVRSNFIYSTGSLVATLHKGNQQNHWIPTVLRTQIADLNKWNRFYDSIILPEKTQWHPFDSIVVQSALGDSRNENFDLDSVTFIIKR